ncbi:SDR family NAD(P)-dependent oxidoreductase [Phytomonospora endophytica]|uniref:NAD(P)-dependent dehydrogenase (Short-subunit alcohol dehydrogenase family) n=1 Tax=Phytomonospora endophytica TaxID=714109 RepID=A0A841G173_9ACTN|nr:SDR family oxidoreductase [Phytomonospora endophytica]MBB6039502.1 NAD(P)-dependent dehydrogenase (short-subunit alcohol dehydrogenase family) [Phytomonospora endophytica]GIG70229.1 oxidoreductase [Phytomonospora endophytica]
MDVPTAEEMAAFHAVLGRLRELPADHEVRLRAEHAAGSFARDGRLRRRRVRADAVAAADAGLLSATSTGATGRTEDAPLDTVDGRAGELTRPRRCYVCKGLYRDVHAFYHLLCPECAADGTRRRGAGTDLSGRRVLLTGGRVKIGFELALMMLRDGAEVAVTTRFPHDALRRFTAAGAPQERLSVLGADLRDPRQVLALCDRLARTWGRLDVLVNNAAQTVRRPVHAYAALDAGETGALPPGAWTAPGFGDRRALPGLVGAGLVDASGLLPDLSPVNSWSATLGGLDPAELLEVQLVNAVAPALLCDRLLPMLTASPAERRYIVNVTAVEGRFAVHRKTSRHPHTNMAKAALNMLTRTSAAELAGRGVYMCAVDTGWITDENPAPKKARLAAAGFRPPLDVVDGAARVYDPVLRGEAGEPVWGVFLKDYREARW